jgi:histone H3/H4
MPRTKQTALAAAAATDAAVKTATKLTKPDALAGKDKKKRRFTHAVAALRRIRKAQKKSADKLAFCNAPFTRLVRSILGEKVHDARVSPDAVNAVNELVQDKMIDLFKDALEVRVAAITPGQWVKTKNVQVDAKHLQLCTRRWSNALKVGGSLMANIREHRNSLGHLKYAQS